MTESDWIQKQNQTRFKSSFKAHGFSYHTSLFSDSETPTSFCKSMLVIEFPWRWRVSKKGGGWAKENKTNKQTVEMNLIQRLRLGRRGSSSLITKFYLDIGLLLTWSCLILLRLSQMSVIIALASCGLEFSWNITYKFLLLLTLKVSNKCII